MKKTLIAMIILLLFSISAHADGIPTVFVENSVDTAEKTIAVNIGISEQSAVCGGKMDIIYDNSLIKPTSYTISENMNDFTALVNLDYMDNSIRFSFAGTEEMKASGAIIQILFDIIKDVDFETEIKIDNLKLADADSNKIEAVCENATASYKQETKQVTVRRHSSGTSSTKSSTKEKTIENTIKNVFSDVGQNDWFYDSVMSVYELGLMQGMSENSFEPNSKLTRAMFITVMHRMSDIPKVKLQAVFTDVDDSAWYADAVAWGYENKIISGISETEFAPNDNITREQIATILYRYARYKGVNVDNIAIAADMSPYPDAVQISDWAADAMRYCISEKIINGNETGHILPQNYASRAEMATMIVRFIQE